MLWISSLHDTESPKITSILFAQDKMNMCNLINRHASLRLYCAFLKNGNLQGVLKYNDTSGLKRQTDSGDFKAFQRYS